MIVTKIGFGVSTGFEFELLLVTAEDDVMTVGDEVMVDDGALVLRSEVELFGVGAGATLKTVVVIS